MLERGSSDGEIDRALLVVRLDEAVQDTRGERVAGADPIHDAVDRVDARANLARAREQHAGQLLAADVVRVADRRADRLEPRECGERGGGRGAAALVRVAAELDAEDERDVARVGERDT